MATLKKVPVMSYYKATMVKLFNNDGEVHFNLSILMNRIKKDKVLYPKLIDLNYVPTNKYFTADQVALIFEHIWHPSLNEANSMELNISSVTNDFITNIHSLLPKTAMGKNNLKKINKLSDENLILFGITKNTNPDYNFYYIEGADDYCLVKQHNGFKLHTLPHMVGVKEITSTKQLLNELLELKKK